MSDAFGLTREDFRLVIAGGFGDHTCRIAQAMAWFGGALFVGTGGRSLNPMGLSDSAMARLGPLAKLAATRDGGTPGGASIWRHSPADGQWTRVFETPDVDYQGRSGPRDRNIRASLVLTEPDGTEALYFGVSAMKGRLRILRSSDGLRFEEGLTSGLGLPDGADIPSIRTLVAAGGWVFSSPVGMIQGRGMLDDNVSAFPQVFRARHPFDDHWEAVSDPGFGDPDNLSVNEMAVLNGWLYAGRSRWRRGSRCSTSAPAPNSGDAQWTTCGRVVGSRSSARGRGLVLRLRSSRPYWRSKAGYTPQWGCSGRARPASTAMVRWAAR